MKLLNSIQQNASGSSTPNGTPKKKMDAIFKDSVSNDFYLLVFADMLLVAHTFQHVCKILFFRFLKKVIGLACILSRLKDAS